MKPELNGEQSEVLCRLAVAVAPHIAVIARLYPGRKFVLQGVIGPCNASRMIRAFKLRGENALQMDTRAAASNNSAWKVKTLAQQVNRQSEFGRDGYSHFNRKL